MGIPRYFRYITNANDNLTEEWSSVFEGADILYLDLNSLIHPVVRGIIWTNEVDFRRDAYKAIGEEIDRLFNMTRPKTVWIAIDGVAPRAKMEQQRRRRYRASLDRQQLAEVSRKYGHTSNRWDTNAISPGTDFMRGLDEYLANYLGKYDRCVFSGSGEAGEGEHKIMADLRSRAESSRVLIYGLDADLIMLSSLQENHEINLLREAIAFGRPVKDKYILFKVGEFRMAVCDDMIRRFNDNDHRIERERLKDDECDDEFTPIHSRLMIDYVFLCFLFGNDFLPHSYWLSLDEDGMGFLLGQYSTILANTSHYLVEIGDRRVTDINFRFLGRLINIVFLREQELVSAKLAKWRNPASVRHRFPEGTLEGDIERLGVVKGATVPVWNTHCYLWTHFRIYDETQNKELIRTISEDYIRMMIWSIRYYVEGVPSWTDVYRWTGSPLLKHLSELLTNRQYMPVFNADRQYTSAEQLALIMPLASKNLIPEPYRTQVIESGYCMDKYDMDKFGHTMVYECEPIMPALELCIPSGLIHLM